MLNIPEEVKRALRAGDRRKKYEFVVRSSYDVVTYSDIFTFNSIADVCNVPKVGTFEWYAAGSTGVVGYYNLVKTDESTSTGDISVGAEIELGYGDTLTITSMNVTPIILREKYVESEMRTDFTIDNDTLVKESVKIDERMATGKKLKFGLCEGSSLEFQYFDHPNINGKQIVASIKVEYEDSNGDLQWYTIPMGYFTVDQCPMQFSTGIYKVTAYNKLKSSYLDNKANALIMDAFSDLGVGQTVKFYDLRRLLLSDYEIDYVQEDTSISYTQQYDFVGNCSTLNYKIKAKYGIDTPLSWERFLVDGYLSTIPQLYGSAISFEYTATLDPTKNYTASLFSNINDYEYDLYNTIIDLISKSTNISGQSFVNNMMLSHAGSYGDPYGGWSDFCGVLLTTNNDQIERYSTVGYEKNASNITGSYNDLRLKTLTGYKKITLRFPKSLYFSAADQSTTINYMRFNFYERDASQDGKWGYGYYTNSSLTDIGHGRYVFNYPNSDTPVAEADLIDFIKIYEVDNLSDADLIDVDPRSLPDVTLRDTLSAVYELEACYGKLDRTTDLFAPVELNQGGLYPQDTLYPADNLYPQGNMVHPFPSSYQKLWTDTIGEQSFRYLIITYKTIENGQEVEKTLQRTVNTYGTTNYNMSDNWLFRNLIWTAEDVGDYADAMVLKMKDIRWFPFEMWAAGLPHIETGDAIEITDKNGDTHTSYVLTRTLDGIQNLQDTFINGELDIF